MTEKTGISLIQTIVNSKKDLFVLFENDEPILANSAFEDFFCVSSLEEYRKNYGEILESFIPHPLYFCRGKIESQESWFDALLKMDEMNRTVSMMTPNYNPHAFSVSIDKSVDNYTIVCFKDITQDLIKRIMIENNANIDKRSGAYDKKYFLHISKSFEDAAAFNEKILGAVLISIEEEKRENFARDERALRSFAENIKKSIRKDDMLIYWEEGRFLLIYLVESQENSQQMLSKLQRLLEGCEMRDLGCTLSMILQKENESIEGLIKRVNSAI